MNRKSQNNKNETQNYSPAQGLVTEVQAFLSQDGESIIHLAHNMRIELPTNLYKSIFGAEFEAKKKEREMERKKGDFRQYGALIRNVPVYFSKDGNYLIHRVFGVRICKHANYYRAILGLSKLARKDAQSTESQVA
jgi:hypothetical protein